MSAEDFAPVVVDLSGKLLEAGDSMPVSGTIRMDSYAVGEKAYGLPEGVSYDLVLTNAGDGILVTGLVKARVTGQCDRCLDPAEFEVAAEVNEYYLFHPEEGEVSPDGDDGDGFDAVGPERTVDLSGPIRDAVVMDTPFVLLCRPDCKGLCPTCGCNLNRETCDCAQKAARERMDSPENPFAALRNLKLDE